MQDVDAQLPESYRMGAVHEVQTPGSDTLPILLAAIVEFLLVYTCELQPQPLVLLD